MAKFTGGAVPLIVRLHDVATLGGLLHRINISYRGTQKPYNVGCESSDAIYAAPCNSVRSETCTRSWSLFLLI